MRLKKNPRSQELSYLKWRCESSRFRSSKITTIGGVLKTTELPKMKIPSWNVISKYVFSFGPRDGQKAFSNPQQRRSFDQRPD
jgi:hypothetical protein